MAWLEYAPDIKEVVSEIRNGDSSNEINSTSLQYLLKYIDRTVSTINPAVSHDGSNVADAPLPKTNPHICNKPFLEIEDLHEDLTDLIATCQRHTHCSAAYCLRTQNGVQACWFGYPKELQAETVIRINAGGELELMTACNDGLISYNPAQISFWRGNVDMQFILTLRRVIEYIVKCACKCEPQSQTMNEVFANIVRNLKDESNFLKVVQKLLINSVGERDYSAQETCHLLLQLPLVKSTRDIIVLSLDGSRQVEEQLQEVSRATMPSVLDH